MGKASKATKKFQSKHLKRTLDQRKEVKKHKKLQGARGKKTGEKVDTRLTKDEQKMRDSAKEEVFKDMSVEQVFEKGIDVPKMNKKMRKQSENKSNDTSDDSSSSEEEDMATNMAALSKEDPEFYKYLQENDKGLLDFAGSNPLDGAESSDEEEGQDAGEEETQHEAAELEEAGSNKIELTVSLVKSWKNELRNAPNLKLLRNVIIAFKVAVHINNEDGTEDHKYAVNDERAFHQLMFVVLKDLPQAIQKMVPYKNTRGSRTLPTGTNVSKISSIIKVHSGSLLTLLNDVTNTETAAMILHSIEQLLPYFLSYRRILKEMLKIIVQIWATTREIETQVAAFAFLHSACKEFKKSALELVLKLTYSTFIKSCRKTNIRSMPLINFQKNSAAELFGIDEALGYQIGFEYIRQLAIHLRNTMSATSKKNQKINAADAYKIVYNWQYCHSLDFWSRVLSFSCNPEKEQGRESPLRQLIYPLVQVTIGTTRLIPAPQFFPLRFYLVKSLIRLSQNTGVFIPIFTILFEVLTSTAFTKPPKRKNNPEAFDFDHNIRCPQGYLGTKIYQDGLCEEICDLLGEYFVLYCKSVSFPELTTPVVISLRRYIKTSKSIKLNKRLSNIVEKLHQNISFIEDKRAHVDFSPSNKTEVNRFLNDVPWQKTPLGSYVSVQREVKEEKAKLIRESLEEADREKEEAKDVEMSDD
ncbi:mRNA-binding ribosome synthesis protein NOC2 KNAG_0A03260 [Huiozyma naganishii CBS 8797]|uniref:Nucleolar complex protein 2 n=1 Tax=Huiozyma naganishii (strain ATCC MYA-139 / BCRC 22969 / CBS 8797 / KCTC 17520 / NBRC 10181 / NCYC 3082 / Yp74L-3) TaxID=1071383 RepID=J7REP2_HUIN7|nr:hypothetical protein KNAG_0A03260 [Kazachstania naganishii CBS 8797]CCK68013.1 hypothetical protein KNAG_0A03260 [Kazachstania naganishii CBS 8797]